MPYFGQISCLSRYEMILLQTEDFRIQVWGPLANHVYGCHVTPVRRGALGYASYQKGIIQGHLVHRYAPRKPTALSSRIGFWAVLLLDVITQNVFLYYMSVKYTLKHYFWCWCPCYALAAMSNRWNQYNFLTLHRLYIWGHRWILLLLLIFIEWNKHSNTKVLATKCILNRFWCIIWRPKNGFWSKCPHYIMGYITHLGSIFFLLSLVLNLAYIDDSLCQIWSVYTQYLRCCGCSNKCLLLVFQQAEVLLNFFLVSVCIGNPSLVQIMACYMLKYC